MAGSVIPMKRVRVDREPVVDSRSYPYTSVFREAPYQNGRPYYEELRPHLYHPMVRAKASNDTDNYIRLLKDEATWSKQATDLAKQEAATLRHHVDYYRQQKRAAEAQIMLRDQYIQELEEALRTLRVRADHVEQDCRRLMYLTRKDIPRTVCRPDTQLDLVSEDEQDVRLAPGKAGAHLEQDETTANAVIHPRAKASTTNIATFEHEISTYYADEDTYISFRSHQGLLTDLGDWHKFQLDAKRNVDAKKGHSAPSFHAVSSMRTDDFGKFYLVKGHSYASWLGEVKDRNADSLSPLMVQIKSYICNQGDIKAAKKRFSTALDELNKRP